MTLAGTRPPTLAEWNKYELHHRARLAIKPGITGMWQVSGRSEITDFWHPNDEGGMAWNDPEIGIEWPELKGEYEYLLAALKDEGSTDL